MVILHFDSLDELFLGLFGTANAVGWPRGAASLIHEPPPTYASSIGPESDAASLSPSD